LKVLEEHERRLYAPPYDTEDVDLEFIPFLERINAKPFAASVQCCAGHCAYPGPGIAPAKSEGRWGYLKLLMTGPSAVWLCQQVCRSEWLVVALSKMWGKNAGEKPDYTACFNFMIAFAWDASSWPIPVEELCSLLEKYQAADPNEPSRFLKYAVPKRIRTLPRTSLHRRRRRLPP
jgi:hypothetical protein